MCHTGPPPRRPWDQIRPDYYQFTAAGGLHLATFPATVRASVNLRCQSVSYQFDGLKLLIIQGT
jgi:hypothetical protein